MIIKICGIQTSKAAKAAEAYGADWIGFVFAKSRRQVSLEQAALISQELHTVKKVGVFVNAPLNVVDAAIRSCSLDFVQLHGDEPEEYCRQVSVPVIRVVAVGAQEKAALPQNADYLLFDTAKAGERGGTGEVFDWNSHYSLRQTASVPVLVAGGLNEQNVGKAIANFRPDGVDVSGGVETDGSKDISKIHRFITAVRKVERIYAK
ncbi:MAG: phosphoribosylanthranilate isomerase [Sporomusaceae bacterium]|nr:phosphoribosylanthranilate isomerase [Sporomusaceae bacterium]